MSLVLLSTGRFIKTFRCVDVKSGMGDVMPRQTGSVVVVVIVVDGVAVSVVDVVDVVAVGDRDVSASLAMDVPVHAVGEVWPRLAVHPSRGTAAQPVEAPVVQIVDVIPMGDGDVPAVWSVLMRLARVGRPVGGVSPQEKGEQFEGHAVVGECVGHRTTVPFSADQAAGAQDAQVVGDQRLRCVQRLAQLGHPGRLVGQAE
jgi:hypothetical protein